jgi:mutator protein MutT
VQAKPKKEIAVVCGVFYRRKNGIDELALFERTEPVFEFEFPGGKIDTGESEREALIRELDEELGVRVQVRDLIGRNDHAYERVIVSLAAYWVETDQAFQLREHRSLVWVSANNWRDLAVAGADHLLLEKAFVFFGGRLSTP